MKKHFTWDIKMFDPDKNFSRVARIAQKVVLEEIYLVETKTWRKPGIVPPEVLTLKNKCYTEIINPKEYKNRSDIFSNLCKFGVLVFTQKSPQKPVLKIEASFGTTFSYDLNDSDFKGVGDPDEMEFDLYKYIYEIIPVSAAWPYWRELAQNLSTRMGYPALMVPLLTIVTKKFDMEKFLDEVKELEL